MNPDDLRTTMRCINNAFAVHEDQHHKASTVACPDLAVHDEIEWLRKVKHNAIEVMRLLDLHGAGIVGHLLDTDDNAGQHLRELLGLMDPATPPQPSLSHAGDASGQVPGE